MNCVAGTYLTIDGSGADKGSRTAYTSAPLALTETQCLTFKYKAPLKGLGNAELRVTKTEVAISRETTLWRVSAGTGDWSEARVTLTPTNQIAHLLTFRAFYGGSRDVALSLDDIKLVSGTCSLPGENL